MATKIWQDEEVDVIDKEDIITPKQLIVYNDDHNSFDWVIKSLIEICKHNSIQAEQLSYMIHFKGKATVKTAELSVLRPLKDGLVDRGLSAVIE